MGERYDDEPRETEVTEVRDEGPAGPPPWWRENWWIPLIVLLLVVGLLIGFFVWRAQDDEEEAAPELATVPSVVGLQEEEARSVLEREGLSADATYEDGPAPEGEVVEQDPEPGSQLPEGSVVRLLVSRGEPEVVPVPVPEEEEPEEEPAEEEPPEEAEQPEEEEPVPQPADLPDFRGEDHRDAGAVIDEAGLITNTFPVQSNEPRGTVVAQNPAPGEPVLPGDRVRLNVSIGPGERESAEIPNVTGEEGPEARRLLREAGFTVRTLDRPAPEAEHVGVVILQQPEPQSAPVLTQVTIFVGRS